MRYAREQAVEELANALHDRGYTFVDIADLCAATLAKHRVKDPRVNSEMVGRWLKLYLVGTDNPASIKSRLVIRTVKAILAQPILECAVGAAEDESSR